MFAPSQRTKSLIYEQALSHVYEFDYAGLAVVHLTRKTPCRDGSFRDEPRASAMITRCGNVAIRPHFTYLGPFAKNGLAAFQAESGASGYIDISGSIIIETKFSYCGDFGDKAFAIVAVKNDQYAVRSANENKYGVIDDKGIVVIEPEHAFIESPDENGISKIKAGPYGHSPTKGLINMKTGRVIAEPIYGEIYSRPGSKTYIVKRYDGKYGLIDDSGRMLFEPQFDEISSFDKRYGIYVSKVGEKYGLINDSGQILFAAKLDEIGGFTDNGLAYVRLGDKYGLIDYRGNLVMKIKYGGRYSFWGQKLWRKLER